MELKSPSVDQVPEQLIAKVDHLPAGRQVIYFVIGARLVKTVTGLTPAL